MSLSFDAESLRVQLEAYKEFNQPDVLIDENVGSSFDAQLAVQSITSTLENRRVIDRQERLNQTFVTDAISVLPETNRPIDIQKPEDLVLARHIQANALWYKYAQVEIGQYVAGIKVDGDTTSVLLVPQTRQKLYSPGDEKDENQNGHFYDMDPYTILNFSTDNFNHAMKAAKEREVTHFPEEELLAMNHAISGLDLQIELDGKSPSSIRMWNDNGFRRPPTFRKRITDKLLTKQVQLNDTVLEIVDYERVDTARISDQTMRDFHVLDRIAQLASSLGSVDAVQTKLSLAEQQ